ncbi:Auxin-responsive protein IAA11 [Linum perenne]
MELQLGLALPTTNTNTHFTSFHNNNNEVKRLRFTEDHFPSDHTLPLFQWPTSGDDMHHNNNRDSDTSSSVVLNRVELEEGEEDSDDGVVGWPPINCRHQFVDRTADNSFDEGGNVPTTSNYCCSMFVKVKMDGVGIGRKVDLSLHDSFTSLKRSLLAMFGIPEENVVVRGGGGGGGYQLTYQDREGDWLLADDISWRPTHLRHRNHR